MSRVEQIVEALRGDPEADVTSLRGEIDEQIFDLFEIRSAREAVLRFYRTIGLVQPAVDQAAAASS